MTAVGGSDETLTTDLEDFPTLFFNIFCQGSGTDMVSVACFGVRVSVMFHLMFVHYTFSSVWVAEWPPFRK